MVGLVVVKVVGLVEVEVWVVAVTAPPRVLACMLGASAVSEAAPLAASPVKPRAYIAPTYHPAHRTTHPTILMAPTQPPPTAYPPPLPALLSIHPPRALSPPLPLPSFPSAARSLLRPPLPLLVPCSQCI